MIREEILCPDCEAEFLIEYTSDKVSFCPFCGVDIDQDEDQYDMWEHLDDE
jgi:hypothetical protein